MESDRIGRLIWVCNPAAPVREKLFLHVLVLKVNLARLVV